MKKINRLSTDSTNYLQITSGIADMPKSLYILGKLPESRAPTVSIVGTRKPTSYGREVTYKLAYDLAKRGVVIVSGLALGIDSIAHKAALDARGTTIAVLPVGLDNICPRSHINLAKQIIQQGGALISEHPTNTEMYPNRFIERNRIVAALCDTLIITEAAIKSGTIHTVNFALDYGKPVLAAPGNINSYLSTGCNNLIKQGATPITELSDILKELNIPDSTKSQQTKLPIADTQQESIIIYLLSRGISDGDELQKHSNLTAAEFNQTITLLELNSKIHCVGANQWCI